MYGTTTADIMIREVLIFEIMRLGRQLRRVDDVLIPISLRDFLGAWWLPTDDIAEFTDITPRSSGI